MPAALQQLRFPSLTVPKIGGEKSSYHDEKNKCALEGNVCLGTSPFAALECLDQLVYRCQLLSPWRE